jgi:hypothetical protein
MRQEALFRIRRQRVELPGTPSEISGSGRVGAGAAGHSAGTGTLGCMATLQQRLRAFLSSPQGKRMITEGQRQLAKPENQRRLRQLINRFRSRR